MSNYELTRVIDDLVQKKTFSLDALDAVKDLKARAESMEKTLQSRESEIRDIRAKNEEHIATINNLKSQVEQHKLREANLLEREKAADKAIYEAEKHKAVADAIRESMQTVFRPAAVRTEIHRSVAVPAGGMNSYPTTMPETETTVVTQE